jgi:hypothetical protein
VQALATRLTSGSWGGVATAAALNGAADSLPTALGGGAFIPFWPERLTGSLSPLDQFERPFGNPPWPSP